ncbi:hypothetical protein ON064_13345 [Planococcus sp. A6]|uniref:hypothetical protein n=1 Tax=Planococcus sp. A6 TaxID=2992760 RepID=UPI00237AEA59|nr:hypothetical protein [Planococcus sp. A6]MDE0584016.1 hypothetical protein [Planococcus sp. A6]
MWFLFGLIAIAATCVNLYLYAIGKNYKLAMAMGLSFTALTLAADYSMVADWVRAEDWSALSDVVPIMSSALWVLTVISILLNIIPVLLEIKSKRE